MITITLLIMLLLLLLAVHLWTDSHYSEALKQNAEDGDMEAQYQLAICYQTGSGIEEDQESARVWFTRAAGQGHAEAGFILNTLFRDCI